jgi:hypothetical protein
MTPAMALPCLGAGAGVIRSQKEQNLCQFPVVVFCCLKRTLRKLASAQSSTLRSGHTYHGSLPKTSCTATDVGSCVPELGGRGSPAQVGTDCPTFRQSVPTCTPCDAHATRAWHCLSAQRWPPSYQQSGFYTQVHPGWHRTCVLSSRRTEHAMEVASARGKASSRGWKLSRGIGSEHDHLLHAIDDALTKAQSLMLVLP